MAWGIGRFKATKNTVALKRPIPPGPSRWAAQHHCAAGRVPKGHPRSWPLSRPSAGNSSFQHPPRTFWRRDVDRYEYSPGRVRSLKATVFFVALRLLTLPGERYPIGQHHGAEALVSVWVSRFSPIIPRHENTCSAPVCPDDIARRGTSRHTCRRTVGKGVFHRLLFTVGADAFQPRFRIAARFLVRRRAAAVRADFEAGPRLRHGALGNRDEPIPSDLGSARRTCAGARVDR